MSDLYSLGVTLYQSLAGRTPFGEASPLKLLRQIAVEDPPPLARFRDDVPPALEAWLMKLLARDAADRFASATAALAALEAIGLAAPARGEAVADATVPAAVMPMREAGRWIPRADVDSILRTAMRMEADGESLVGERSVLEIARELDVDEAFVRKTLDAYQQLAPERRGRQRGSGLRDGRSRLVVFLIAAVVAVLLVLLISGITVLRFTSQEKADLRRQEGRAALGEMKVTLPVPRAAPDSRVSRDAEIILLNDAQDARGETFSGE